jgi:hypothetical protein
VTSSKLPDLPNQGDLESEKDDTEEDEDEDAWVDENEDVDDREEEGESRVELSEELDYDQSDDSDNDAASQSLPPMTTADLQEACNMLSKASRLAIFIKNSPTHREQFRTACQSTNSPNLALIRPVKTCWNSHAQCLICTLILWKAVHSLCGDQDYESYLIS